MRRCPYRRRLVDAANLVTSGTLPPSAEATEELAHGLIYLDVEMSAVQIDLERAHSDLKAAKEQLRALTLRVQQMEGGG